MIFGLLRAACGAPVSQFATQALRFWPAPGQFVNSTSPPYSNPQVALGAPKGVGINPPMSYQWDSIISLGAFGGSVTLAFDHTVKDDPNDPFGMDAVVFGNSFWVGSSPRSKFQEPGVIEISRDVNHNGQADDPWYVIPGSHITGAPSSVWASKEYDRTDPAYPPTSKLHYPNTTVYPTYPDHVALSGYKPLDLGAGAVTVSGDQELTWGYAECSPTLKRGDLNADNFVDDSAITDEEFYTTADDPKTVGITPSSGGGDAFDIAWAVDSTGAYANLDGFDFIRITTGVDVIMGINGEASPEIDAVADASPQPQPVQMIKTYPDGVGARLLQAVVSAAYDGEFYVQEGQISGIRVISPVSVTPGDLVNVIGSVRTIGSERCICSLDSNNSPHDAFVRADGRLDEPPQPVGLPNARIGGADLNAFTPGVTGGVGLNNIGLLVRTWGAVKSVGVNYFYISDGSLPAGQTLKVSPGSLTLQNPRYVIVTGVSSCEPDGRRIIRPRSQSDIIEIP